MFELLGFSPEELTSREAIEYGDLIHPDDAQFVWDTVQENIRRNQPFKLEYRITDRNGQEKWVWEQGQVVDVNDEDQEILEGLITDITEQKNAEEALRQSKNYYRSIFETTGSAVFVSEEDTTIYHVNSMFEVLTGYSREEVEGKKSWTELVHRDDLELMREYHQLRRLDPNAAPKNYELRFFDRSNELHHGYMSVDIIPGTTRSVLSIVDTTERKKAETALKESETRFRELADFLPVIVYEADLDGWFTFVNRQGYDMTGYTPEDIQQGLNYLTLVPEDERETMRENVRRRLNGEEIGYKEYTMVKKDGEKVPVVIKSSPIVKDGEPAGVRGIVDDISEQKRMRQHLEELVMKDYMTGLHNRRAFQDDIARKIARSERDGSRISLLTIDVDNFKRFNDDYGHSVGDDVLIEAAGRLQESVRESDTVYRIGGDEFAILLDPVSEEYDAGKVADRLIRNNSQPYSIQDKEFNVTFSMGIANYPALSKDKDELISNSDTATKYAKRNRTSSNYVHFNANIYKAKRKEKEIINTIDRALEEGHLQIKYQPIFSCTGLVERVEALARIVLPEDTGHIISPGEFIPVAEETGQIKDIDSYMLQKACEDMDGLASFMYDTYRKECRLGVSVNISSYDITDSGFLQRNEDILDKASIHPKNIFLEITEQSIIDNPENVIKNMEALKEKGIRFSIDDFGKGHSSLYRLIGLPVDELKIDKVYINKICYDEKYLGVVEFITHLASRLGMVSTAEGIETREQYDLVCSVGCNSLQGFYSEKLSPPLLYTELRDFVTRI